MLRQDRCLTVAKTEKPTQKKGTFQGEENAVNVLLWYLPCGDAFWLGGGNDTEMTPAMTEVCEGVKHGMANVLSANKKS